MSAPERTVPGDNAPTARSAAAIDIGLLGPLRLAADGAESTVTSSRSRTFLALLALQPGRRVGLYEFADAIWGADPPQNPRRAVQLCAVRVRAHLERLGAGDLVVTCPDGYRLDLAREHTDLGRVAALLRTADAADDPAAELAAVTAALAQWRGEPLADIGSETLRREVVPRLRERHLYLTERRIDLLLRDGAVDLVDELLSLTARHPLRERSWRLLMTALHQAGRRGEALAAYHTLARRLRDELGIDPGEELRGLHAAILTSRDESDPRPVATPRVPRELPSDPAAFTGRDTELAELDGLLAALADAPGPVVAVLTGTAGVGKTSLAVHWARRAAEEFPDGQLFVNLRGYHPEQALTPQRVLARFLRTLGVLGTDIPTDLDELTARYRSVMDGRRMLVVLDNVNDSDQARPLLPSTPGCLVLITSRDVLLSLVAADGARQLGLELPSTDQARRMLARRLGTERLAAEPGAVDAIIAASARLPLALAIAAARAVIDRDTRLSVVARQLRGGLDAFDTASPLTDVRAVFSWSYRALSLEAARLLRLLGLHPGPEVSIAAAASLAGLPVDRVEALLAELLRAHLVTEPVVGRYGLHDLMREYCVETAHATDTETERDLARHRLLDHYLHTGHAAAVTVNPRRADIILDEATRGIHRPELPDRDAATAWFAAEREVLLAVVDWAVGHGYDRRVTQLVRVFAGYLERQGLWTQLVGCHQTAIAAAERLGDPIMLARAHRGLGVALTRMSTRAADADAHYATALRLYRDSGHRGGQARTETSLALLREQQHRYPEALEHARRALELRDRREDPAAYADVLNTVGWCHALVGQHELALDHARRALVEHRDLDNPVGQAATLDTIGYAHHHLGRHSEAIASYREAIAASRQLGDRFHTALSLLNLGDSHAALGESDAAVAAWREAESILAELRHPSVATARAKLVAAATES